MRNATYLHSDSKNEMIDVLGKKPFKRIFFQKSVKQNSIQLLLMRLLHTIEKHCHYACVFCTEKIYIREEFIAFLLLERTTALRKKCPYSELFSLVFSRIWTEYGEMRSVSSYFIYLFFYHCIFFVLRKYFINIYITYYLCATHSTVAVISLHFIKLIHKNYYACL